MKSPILSSSFPFAGDIYATTAAARQGVVRGRTDSSVAVPFRIPKQQQHLEDSKRIIRKGKTHTHMRRQLVWKHSGQTSGQKKKGRRQWWIPRKIQSSRIFRRKEEKKRRKVIARAAATATATQERGNRRVCRRFVGSRRSKEKNLFFFSIMKRYFWNGRLTNPWSSLRSRTWISLHTISCLFVGEIIGRRASDREAITMQHTGTDWGHSRVRCRRV